MTRRLLEIAVLAGLIAVATVWIGWWTVPLVGAGWGFARHGEPLVGTTAAVSASLAWVVLLGIMAAQGPVGLLARRVGGVFGIPGWAFLALALVFPALLAGAAAVAAGTVAGTRR